MRYAGPTQFFTAGLIWSNTSQYGILNRKKESAFKIYREALMFIDEAKKRPIMLFVRQMDVI